MRDEVYKAAELFKAFSDPTRLMIVKILASDMARDIKVTDIADMLGISQPAVSQHLKVLKNAGVLTAKREGYRILYNIDVDSFKKHKQLVDTVFDLAFKKCGKLCLKGEPCKELKDGRTCEYLQEDETNKKE